MWMWSRSYLLSEHFFWQFVSICDQQKELRFLKKKSRSCYDYWKEVKCLMRILCVKVIWEAEALIFQNSSGKFMNIVISYICGNVFTEDLQLFADQVLICFANSALMRLFIVLRNELIDCYSVKTRMCLISKQLLNKS